jgi:cytochrome c
MHVFKQSRVRSLAALGLAFSAALLLSPSAGAEPKYGIGTPATPEQISGWNINIYPDGRNLPAGSATVMQGKEIYAAQCAACHGAKGERGMGNAIAGGMGSLATNKPVRTVGSYWPYATTLFDYIRRAMPITAPQTLSDEETYAVSGYVLFLNGLVSENATIDAKTLTDLQMPNRGGFVPDPRPDVGTVTTAKKDTPQ